MYYSMPIIILRRLQYLYLFSLCYSLCDMPFLNIMLDVPAIIRVPAPQPMCKQLSQ